MRTDAEKHESALTGSELSIGKKVRTSTTIGTDRQFYAEKAHISAIENCSKLHLSLHNFTFFLFANPLFISIHFSRNLENFTESVLLKSAD